MEHSKTVQMLDMQISHIGELYDRGYISKDELARKLQVILNIAPFLIYTELLTKNVVYAKNQDETQSD